MGYLDSTISLDSPIFAILPPILQPDLDIELLKFSANVAFDTRDNTFYPTSGVLLSGKISHAEITDTAFNSRLTVSDRSYQKGLFSASAYKSVGQNGVIAGKALLCGAGSDAPFFDTCGVGFADGLRGFG